MESPNSRSTASGKFLHDVESSPEQSPTIVLPHKTAISSPARSSTQHITVEPSPAESSTPKFRYMGSRSTQGRNEWIPRRKRRRGNTSSDTELESLPERDRQRQQEQDERRRVLHKRLQASGQSEESDIVYVDVMDHDQHQKSLVQGQVFDPSKGMDRINSKPHQWIHNPSLPHQTTEPSSQPVSLDEALVQWNGHRHEVPVASPAASKSSKWMLDDSIYLLADAVTLNSMAYSSS